MKKDVHKEVKKRYGQIAKTSSSCCGPAKCGLLRSRRLQPRN